MHYTITELSQAWNIPEEEIHTLLLQSGHGHYCGNVSPEGVAWLAAHLDRQIDPAPAVAFTLPSVTYRAHLSPAPVEVVE